MTEPERIEDLGRLRERLNHLLEQEWPLEETGIRPKDFQYWFDEQSLEKQAEILRELAYFLYNLQEELLICLLIAKGEDEE